jgi:glycine/D-amino acid oxidase-like deaminating enzyme/nitrite reductase/ring-hydroxylating ferredoxin subunit
MPAPQSLSVPSGDTPIDLGETARGFEGGPPGYVVHHQRRSESAVESQSVWFDGAAPPLRATAVSDTLVRTWDLVVVGAGIAGLMCALKAREDGRHVCLLEANRVGEGTTARATVKITSGHGALLGDVASRHGLAVAVEYQRMNDAGFVELSRLAARVDEPVGWRAAPHIVHASSNDSVRRLRASEVIATSAGSKVHAVAPPAWASGQAWSWDDSALVNPLSFARALARLLLSMGAQIIEGATVVNVSDAAGLMGIHLRDGRILRSADVVIATHAPVLDPDMLAVRAPVFRHAAVALPVGDIEVPVTYDVDGLSTRPVTLHQGPGAVVVGPAQRPGSMSKRHWTELEEWARMSLGATGPGTVWAAQDVYSPDLLPFAGRSARSPHVIVVSGFSGWGFTNAAAAATEARRLLDTDASAEQSSAAPSPWNAHRTLAPRALAESASSAWWMVRSTTADVLRSITPATGLSPGEGRVAGGPIAPKAECRTLDGTLHEVSARCTHLGCLVRWNATEQSWDCPCHGSRFAPDGQVREGPASAPLPRIKEGTDG